MSVSFIRGVILGLSTKEAYYSGDTSYKTLKNAVRYNPDGKVYRAKVTWSQVPEEELRPLREKYKK